jgi:hypothetical protein
MSLFLKLLTDDPENFNLEFIRIFDRGRYHIQIQTSGEGDHCETKLPDQLQGKNCDSRCSSQNYCELCKK